MTMTKKSLTSLSFFSGCLGLDIGMEKVGIKTLLYCDNDPSCIETIKINRPKIPLIKNILDYSSDEIREISGLKKNQTVDIMVGGSPCQAFSTAGKRRGLVDARGNVLLQFLKLICDIKPRYFVIENVRGILSVRHNDEAPGSVFLYIKNYLEDIGYNITFNLYNAANFGSPQIRERVIFIGTRDKNPLPFLEPTHSDNPTYGLPKWRTFGDAVTGLKESEMDYIEFPKKRLKFYKMLSEGQNWRDLPNETIKQEALGNSYFLGGGKTGFYRRLSFKKPSPTLVTHPSMPATDLCHPKKNRPLSIQEYQRIQEFPDDWVISGTIINKYKQLGNAVPVSLGYAIGKLIVNHSKNKKFVNKFDDFKYSRYRHTCNNTWGLKYGIKQKKLILG